MKLLSSLLSRVGQKIGFCCKPISPNGVSNFQVAVAASPVDEEDRGEISPEEVAKEGTGHRGAQLEKLRRFFPEDFKILMLKIY